MPTSDLSQITYRKLNALDHEAFEAHLLALDADSIYARFGMIANHDFLVEYAARCIAINAVMHGAFVEEKLIGVAEMRPIGVFFVDEAEIAFSVLAEWRLCGIGAKLFQRILRSARNRGYHRLYMSCLKHNAPMHALARKFSAQIRVEQDEDFGVLEAPQRTLISVLGEAFDDASSLAAQAFDWQRTTFMGAGGLSGALFGKANRST